MLYQSTRGNSSASGTQAVLRGIAPDGGLYIDPGLAGRPFDVEACLALPPLGMAEVILSHLLPDFEDMGTLVRLAYCGKFDSDEPAPLVEVGDDYALELFHGPTSAFKDVALSMLPRLMTAARRQEGVTDKILILTATSGDTGKAALEGFHDVPGTCVTVFYPKDGVSPVQLAQMATQRGDNVRVCAVRGNFDDCQRGVKDAFSAINSRGCLDGKGLRLSSANSINIGRLAPQVTYYFSAYAALLRRGAIKPGQAVDFVVPTGNFGDILAGYFAKLMGLPVGALVCASNANRVLTDFIRTGVYDRRRDFIKTSSPSMDILVSSNLERLLFLASGGDCALMRDCMDRLGRDGVYALSGAPLQAIQSVFYADSCGERETAAAIERVWRDNGYLCDTHTAVAFNVAEKYKAARGGGAPVVVLSTASPYKFPAAVLRAVGGDCAGDEFRQMETLEGLSGVPIPRGLSGLCGAKIRHRDCIGREDILGYVLDTLDKTEG
ncbi:MAG: threonine synthase [Oscillospiraceae bacterium]|nr:threonine synthase [Oscillospiraceae bacterium]